MPKILLSKEDNILRGELFLPGSKSISNRVLIMDAYNKAGTKFYNLSCSDDTNTLVKALKTKEKIIDVGMAGTCFRFLTSYFSIKGKEKILTGSQRLKERPIAPLAEALNSMGTDISYLEKEGYAPILIKPVKAQNFKNKVQISGNISSQFISSLLMSGPMIQGGLEIELTSDLVSSSYVNMTLRLMMEFGIEVRMTEKGYFVPQGRYEKKKFSIESDWSSTSYILIMSAIAKEVELYLYHFNKNSVQGDSRIEEWLRPFGLEIEYKNSHMVVRKVNNKKLKFIEKNFIDQPDLFQGLSVFYATQGASCLFSGMETLKVKETDRIKAMQTELGKFQVFLSKAPLHFSKKTKQQYYIQEGVVRSTKVENIKTYNDHRMAMSFAMLALKFPLAIEDPGVVSKSYPGFWDDLETLGFTISPLET